MDYWAADDPEFAEMIGWTEKPLPFADAFSQIWALGYAHGTLYAGTKPAGLLASQDGGKTWEKIKSLTDHPSAGGWNPGAAGLILHTIVSDPSNPKKLWVGISAAGVFATEDGGTTWERRNRLSNAEACDHPDHPAAPRNGEIGHCVHSIVRAPGANDLLYQQNHHGVWRSSDGGRSWDDITRGLPSTFGFPIRVHPRDPNTIWTLPLNGDSAGRFPPRRSGAHVTVAIAGRTCAKDCHRRGAFSLCFAKLWEATRATRQGSISALIVVQCSRASMRERVGKRSRIICRRYYLSKCSTAGDIPAAYYVGVPCRQGPHLAEERTRTGRLNERV